MDVRANTAPTMPILHLALHTNQLKGDIHPHWFRPARRRFLGDDGKVCRGVRAVYEAYREFRHGEHSARVSVIPLPQRKPEAVPE